MDYTIKIGGEAEQGIQTIGDTFARVFSRMSCHVFGHQDYESRIRGGHNFYQIRLSDKLLSATKVFVDIIVAFDRDSITHRSNGATAFPSVSFTAITGRHSKSGSR